MEKFFLNYDDPNATENFIRARKLFPTLTLFETKDGIAQSHKNCSMKSFTDQFVVIDSDNYLLDFSLEDFYNSVKEKNKIYVFRSKNPINDLEYGHGGIKVFQRSLFVEKEVVDFTTSFVGHVQVVNKTLSIHRFNTSEFQTWRTSVRECAKLSAAIIPNRRSAEDEYRLDIWCSKFNDVPYAEFAELGAKFGKEYGYANRNRLFILKRINDYKWLKEQYEQLVQRSTSI